MCPKKYPKMQLFGCRVNRIRPSLTKKIYQKLSQNPILWMQGKSYSMTQFAKENSPLPLTNFICNLQRYFDVPNFFDGMEWYVYY